MARDLAIDLGTANTLVYARGQGIILNEPTVIALNSRTQDVLAMGHDAWQMIGRTPGYIVAVRPLRGGAITDFDITQRMIRLLFQRAGVSRIYRARVLICVPSAITHVEQRAVLEAARRAGAAATYLIEQPMAAAIGAGLQIHEPLGNMVIDVGGGGMLRGLDLRIAKETSLPVRLVDAPLECVVEGAGRCLESFDLLKDMFMGNART